MHCNIYTTDTQNRLLHAMPKHVEGDSMYMLCIYRNAYKVTFIKNEI